MKTTLVKFPGEPVAVLKYGDREIEMSMTFVHALVNQLAQLPTNEGNYSRDMSAFQSALVQIEATMVMEEGGDYTDAERTLLLERSYQHGAGYWSSWMDHPDPFLT